MAESYNSKLNKAYTRKLRKLLQKLPSCCATFMRGIESQTSVLTRYGYAVDLCTFFEFAVNELDGFSQKKIEDLSLNEIEQIRPLDIELFLEHLSLYSKSGREVVNKERAKARKLSSLRSFLIPQPVSFFPSC